MKVWLAIFFCTAMSFSQTRTVNIGFKPAIDSNGPFAITVFKFYVSNVTFVAKGKPVYQVPDSYFLIDFTDAASLLRTVQVPETCIYDQILFTLGIDEKTNENGIGDGDLDPLHGMYWAWQSGYINLKLEGTRNGKPFELHLGGFQKPYLACQPVLLQCSGNDITIFADPQRFLKEVPVGIINVMSPGEKAVFLSELAVKMFYR